jgi:drug/metabolite transporter (DMT)-like permease
VSKTVTDPAQPVQHGLAAVPPRRAWAPLLAAGITMVLWASAFVVIRALGGDFGPGALALGRLVVGSVVLTAVALRRPVRLPRGRALVLVLTYGALWFGMYTVAVNAAGRYLDAGTSAMLVNLAPIIIAVLAGLFLGEGFPRGLVIGLVVAFAGVLTICAATTTGRVSPLGVGLALAAAGLYSVGVLLQKQALATVDPVTVTWLGALAGVLATLPFAPQLLGQLSVASTSAILGMVYLGVFPTAIAFLLWTYALSHTTAGRMSASSYVVPGIAVLLSWLFLAEVPETLALIGGGISLVGVAITRLVPSRSRPSGSGGTATTEDTATTGGPALPAADATVEPPTPRS